MQDDHIPFLYWSKKDAKIKIDTMRTFQDKREERGCPRELAAFTEDSPVNAAVQFTSTTRLSATDPDPRVA
jgi:hypothetical protein